MPIFERLDFPKKYPIPGWIKIAVVIAVLGGVLIHNCSQNNLDREIEITDIKITEFSRVHVEIEYTITNKSIIDRDVWLLLKVFDNSDDLVGSTLFFIKTEAGKSTRLIKIIDKLEKPLIDDVEPVKAVFEVFKRKVLS